MKMFCFLAPPANRFSLYGSCSNTIEHMILGGPIELLETHSGLLGFKGFLQGPQGSLRSDQTSWWSSSPCSFSCHTQSPGGAAWFVQAPEGPMRPHDVLWGSPWILVRELVETLQYIQTRMLYCLQADIYAYMRKRMSSFMSVHMFVYMHERMLMHTFMYFTRTYLGANGLKHC